MTGITSAGIFLLCVFTLRGVAGFREDYLYFKKEKLSLRSYYKYLKNKVKRGVIYGQTFRSNFSTDRERSDKK